MATKSIVKLISVPVISDDCQLGFLQSPLVPFPIKRTYFITQPTASLARGFHAHHQTDQLLVCLGGSVKLVVDDGYGRESVQLSNPDQGILLPRMLWHEMHDMTPETVLLVLASKEYEPSDYIRDYEQFKKEVNASVVQRFCPRISRSSN